MTALLYDLFQHKMVKKLLLQKHPEKRRNDEQAYSVFRDMWKEAITHTKQTKKNMKKKEKMKSSRALWRRQVGVFKGI